MINKSVIYLDWDSIFFTKRIGKVILRSMNETDARNINEWAVTNRIDCLYYLADGSNPASCIAAENNGFHLVDLRMTYHID